MGKSIVPPSAIKVFNAPASRTRSHVSHTPIAQRKNGRRLSRMTILHDRQFLVTPSAKKKPKKATPSPFSVKKPKSPSSITPKKKKSPLSYPPDPPSASSIGTLHLWYKPVSAVQRASLTETIVRSVDHRIAGGPFRHRTRRALESNVVEHYARMRQAADAP